MQNDPALTAVQRTSSWTSRDVVRAALLVIAIYAIAQLLWHARALALTAFLGVLFGLAVASGTDRLQRARVPRGIGASLIVLGALGVLGAFGTWIGPTVREQSVELRTKLPEALDKLENWVDSRGGGVIAAVLGLEPDTVATVPAAPGTTITVVTGEQSAEQPSEPSGLRERLLRQIGGVKRYFLPVLTSTVAVVAGIVLVIFLAIYVAVDPKTYRGGALYLVPAHVRPQADAALTAVATTLRRWLVTQLIAMVVIGVVTTAVLLALNVRAAVPLGILAGLLEFVPTIGPIISAIPAIAMGFVDSPEKALAVTIAYVGIQFLENHILIPILMKEGVDLPPALTIVTQALMALVFGFLGLLVAVPMLAAVVVTVKTLTRAEEPAGTRATPGVQEAQPAASP